jgi:hypothetical protein
MPYVERDATGAIMALRDAPTARALEFLDDDAPEIRNFAARQARADEALETLRASDDEFIRVLEDLIDLLTAKSIIRLDELPAPVRAKLARRAALRDRFRSAPLLKFDDDLI